MRYFVCCGTTEEFPALAKMWIKPIVCIFCVRPLCGVHHTNSDDTGHETLLNERQT